MAKSSEVMQIVFSMKSRVEIMAIHYCMLELVFFKVLSHTDTVHVAEDASESAFIRYLLSPGKIAEKNRKKRGEKRGIIWHNLR